VFKNINKLGSPKDKKTFVSYVNIYIKLINVFKENNRLSSNEEDKEYSLLTELKLIELGIIGSNKQNDQKLLIRILKKELYLEFVSTINFNLKYKNKIGNLLDKLDPVRRKKIQEKTISNDCYKVADFFCGAGGLSLGFSQQGFQIDLANDNEEVCIETYKYNHPEIPEKKIIHGDIKEIVNNLDQYFDNEIDVMVGGPPCQGFSYANQQRIIDDPRNELYKYFVEGVSKLLPKFVIMENVRGMLPFAEQVKEDFKSINVKNTKGHFSYDLGYKLLVSDQFGVAQKRPRLFFVAIRSDIIDQKKQYPDEVFDEIENESLNLKKHVLKDALDYIKVVKAPRIKNMTEIDDDITGKLIDINQFSGNENSYLNIINQNKHISLLYNHKARYTNDINLEIYSRLDQGDDGSNEKIKDIMPYQHRGHIFKDKYFKLDENKPSRTITAHLRMDCHSHIHPNQARGITPREAARIQSFPDDYFFLGPYLKTYMQIGNAVPPLMANVIAKVIKKFLNQ